ncbi:MAG: hypothetical protein Q8P90_06285 [bacterium]|nr:hypothetical protein [bacterium]
MKYVEEQLKAVDLSNQDVYQAIIDHMHDNIIFSRYANILDTDGFFTQWYEINPDFTETFPDRAEELNTRLIESRWIALPAMPEDKVIDLFKNHLNILFLLQKRHDIIIEGFDLAKDTLTEKLRGRLLNIPVFNLRDKFKKLVITALSTNEELITVAPFYLGIKEAQPTAKNWFSEYIEFMGGEEFKNVKQKAFYSKNENYLKLTDEEQKRLQMLFDVYEQLKISSWKETGIEETVAFADEKGIGVVQYGKLQRYKEEDVKNYEETMKNLQDLMMEGDVVDLRTLPPKKRPPVAHVTAGPTKSFSSVTTGPDVSSTAGPDHFSELDSKEIAEHAELTAVLSKTQADFVEQAKKLVVDLKLTFESPELEKKFTDIVSSTLRGLRDTMELQSYLQDLKYSESDVERIVKTVKDEANQEKKAKRVAEDIQAQDKIARQTKAKVNAITPDDASMSTTPLSSAGVSGTVSENVKKSFLPKLRRSRNVKKQMIDDVKIQQSMVMGPIDELRAMDLVEFRRLSTDSVVSANKLKEKIDLLMEQSVSEQAEGVKALKESPINQLYLDIGNQSIATGKPVTEIIAELEASGNPTLNISEFNAIADLNKELRF